MGPLRRPLHDMEKRLFDVIPEFGIVQWWHYDEDTDTATIETVQNTDHIVEAAKAQYNLTDKHTPYRDGMHHVAYMPLVVLQEFMVQGKLKDQKALKAWLNDPANEHLRTRRGRV